MQPPRKLRLSPAQSKLARASQRLLLATEAQALADLRAATHRALGQVLVAAEAADSDRHTKRRLLLAIHHAADGLRQDLQAQVARGRRAARDAALQRTHLELAAALRAVRGAALTLPAASPAPEDAGRAAGAAESFTASWRAALSAAVLRAERNGTEDAAPPPLALRAASDGQDYRLRRIAVTEVAEAYGAEHAEAAATVEREHPSAAWLTLLVRVWDATLDRKLCPTCARMDGRWALLGTRFKGDLEPGAVHPHCRCVPVLLALKPAVLIPGSAYLGARAAA